MVEEDQLRQSARGSNIAQAYGEGATATVNTFNTVLTPEQVRDLAQEDKNRRDMLGAVRRRVDELLEKTVNKDGELGLGFVEVPDALVRLEEWSRVPYDVPAVVPAGTPVLSVFEKFGRHLLILGAPGAGKTTLLRKLARSLVELAEKDGHKLIPVIVELSTWATERRPLTDWMVERLQQSYRVPRKVAEDWVKRDKILPLLDGLDEVPLTCRDACIDAINQFCRKHGLVVPVAVCCRVKDYDSIGQKLELDGAVAIQPLARADVEDYLQRLGKPLEGVTQMLVQDATVWELLDTPLMVDILVRSYQDLPAESLALPGGIDEQRRHLFRAYVDRMFQHRPGSRYPRSRVEYWLTWLAQQLFRHHEKDFYLEDLQVDWLSQKTRWCQRWAFALVVGLVVGLGGGLIFWLVNGPLFWLGAGRGGLVKETIEPVETMHWSWQRAVGSGGRLVVGLRDGLVVALGVLGVQLVFGLLSIINNGLGPGKVEQKLVPNQAIWASLRNCLICAAIGLVIALFLGLLFLGLVGGLLAGLVFGMNVGGAAFIQHFVLRAQLAFEGFAPFRYVPFLEYATTLLFLERNGGAYRFRHDLLREYFAALIPTRDGASN